MQFKRKYLLIVLCICLLGFLCGKTTFVAREHFSGEGTVENPYLISDYEDLETLRDLVNKGNTFDGVYFRQVEDIRIQEKNWRPIGFGECVFSGIYDGNGHYVSELNIKTSDKKNYYGFFGRVSGVVANLGIESGEISAPLSASIVGESVGEDALIINCYNKANVKGKEVAGIAGNTPHSDIVGCLNLGGIEGEKAFAITSCGYDVQIYSCYSIVGIMHPDSVVSTTSYNIPIEALFDSDVVDKINMKVGLAQYMYAQVRNVQLLQWEVSETGITYSIEQNIIDVVEFLNYNLMTIILVIIIVFGAFRIRHFSIGELWQKYRQRIYTFNLISGTVAFFLDTALITRETSNLRFGNTAFIIMINLLFLGGIFVICKNITNIPKPSLRKSLPLLIAILFIVVLEIFQFDIVPKYDACLYYGSFVKGAKMFNMDLLTYIGAFVCWKWLHGLALFIAPFEFLLPGQMIGVYIGNVIITIITMYFLYKILNAIFVEIHSVISALTCAILFLLPYELGLFAYLNMDSHLALFCVWLIYAQLKKDDYLTAFCGYLLAFTKITGLCFYVFYLIMIAGMDILQRTEGNIFKNFVSWFSIKKVVLWVSPAVLFLLTLIIGDYFTIQNFYGTYVAESSLKFAVDIATLDTIVQAFGYGFRWLILFMLLVALCVYGFKNGKRILNEEGKIVYSAIFFAMLFVFLVLLLYNADANCPRYTAIMNVMYTFFVPLIVMILWNKNVFKVIGISFFAIIMLVQTYWTIDPLIIGTTTSIDIGKTKLYRLAAPSDDRPGMNIGLSWGRGYPSECDIYTYNLQYSYADSLLNQLFREIEPTEEDIFYVLDLYEYDLHVSGSFNRNYKIYWDTEAGKRTYDKWNENSIYVPSSYITTDQFIGVDKNSFPEHFYLIVHARINSAEAQGYLEEAGYKMMQTYHAENLYGYIDIIEFKK